MFWNFGSSRISVTIEGNQLFSNGMLPKDIYEECQRFFAGMYKKDRSIDNMVK